MTPIEAVGEFLANAPDLEPIKNALTRESVIRNVMLDSGESRQVVTDMVDAMRSMDQEAVLDLTEGEPTTILDALNRYIDVLDAGDEIIPRDRVMGDLSAIINFPWSGEEALIQLHESNPSLRLEIVEDEESDRDMVIRIGGHQVAGINWERTGSGGMAAAEEVAVAVYRAVLVRVIADREHHVQLNAAETADLRAWLAKPRGSMTDGQRLSLDAVEGGGVLVRTKPYQYVPAPRTQV